MLLAGVRDDMQVSTIDVFPVAAMTNRRVSQAWASTFSSTLSPADGRICGVAYPAGRTRPWPRSAQVLHGYLLSMVTREAMAMLLQAI